jgi:exodeoxyribonuclease VII small subunit
METLSFEEAFERLEAAITALQDGKMPLDRALQQYQDGMKLTQHCNELLQRAEPVAAGDSQDREGVTWLSTTWNRIRRIVSPH